MTESALNGVRYKPKEGEIPLQMKFDRNILEVWFQDEFNREKGRLKRAFKQIPY